MYNIKNNELVNFKTISIINIKQQLTNMGHKFFEKNKSSIVLT